MIGIGFELFADSTKLEKGLSEAEHGIEKTEKVAKKLGIAFGGWKVASEFLQLGLERATELRDEAEKLGKPIDYSVNSVASLADGFKKVKESVADVAVTSISWFTTFGEGIGSMINEMRGFSKMEQVQNEASEKALTETLARIAKVRDGYAEAMKKSQENLKKTETELFEATAASGQKLAKVITEVVALEEQLSKTGEGSLRWNELRAELNTKLAQQAKLQVEFTKEGEKASEEYTKALEAHTKVVEELDKADADAAKALMLSNNEMLELVSLQQKKSQGLNESETKRIAILEQQVKLKKIQVEVDEILSDGEITGAESKRLAILQQQKTQIEAQIAEQEKLTNKVEGTVAAEKERTNEIRSQLTLVGKYNDELSDLELSEKSKEIKKDLLNRQLNEQSYSGGIGGGYYDPLASYQKQQLKGVEDEQKARKTVARLVSQYGEEGGFKFFQGSATEYERLAALVSTNSDDSKNISSLAKHTYELNERLRKAGFSL